MKYIKEEPSGQDKDIECPVFKLNFREVEILFAILSKADLYIPDVLMPDKGRIKMMQKIFGKYIRQKEVDTRRMKIKIDGLKKTLILTAHAMQRMHERNISLDYVKTAIINAKKPIDEYTTKMYEYEDAKFIIDENDESLVLITLYRNEEIL